MFAYDKRKPKGHWQHWTHKTQDGRRQTKHNTENLQDEQHEPHQTPGVNPGGHEEKVVPASYKTSAFAFHMYVHHVCSLQCIS